MAERENDRPVDIDIIRAPEELPTESSGRPAPVLTWVLAVAFVAVAAAAAYIAFRGTGQPASDSATLADRALPPDAAANLGGAAMPVVVPPLDQSDPVVRELLRQLTSHPRVAAWLATDGLIRNFTVVVANTADGATPARHLRVLRPAAAFSVDTTGNGIVLDPLSYRRYDEIASALASVDPAGAARLYATLKPRIAEAYKDLGHPDTPVDQALERALVALLETPVVQGPIHLHPVKGTGYAFDDPRLESLTDAQKQLLRTGPDNMRVIQGSLRSMALALGIGESRLPAARTVVETH
jgi:hypothetical protein